MIGEESGEIDRFYFQDFSAVPVRRGGGAGEDSRALLFVIELGKSERALLLACRLKNALRAETHRR